MHLHKAFYEVLRMLFLGYNPHGKHWLKTRDFQKQSFIQFLKEPMNIHLPNELQDCPTAPGCAADMAQASLPGPGTHSMEDRNRQGSFLAPPRNSSPDFANLNTTRC